MNEELDIPGRSNAWLGGENQNKGGAQRETRWLTPPHITDALGAFDLDPCGAPGHSLAARTYLLENDEDGLSLPWDGRVWLNPPYGPAMEPFIRRLAEHGQGTALIFARTETRVFHQFVWEQATSILFLRGRISFLDSAGVAAKANAGAPSCLVAYGEQDAEVLASCAIPGKVVSLR